MSGSTGRVEIACDSCGARIAIEPIARTARCPYCDSPSVIDRSPTADRPDPAYAIGFVLDRSRAEAGMRRHISGRKMAPFGLRRKTAERVSGVYLPAYLYSATAATSYAATIAELYETVGVSSDSDGDVSFGRKRKIEHRQLEGVHTVYLGDIMVTATRGVSNHEIEAIEPFDLEGLRRYSPALIAGWPAEEPSLSVAESLELARREAEGKVTGTLRRFMPGDGHTSLRQETALQDESLDLVLLPVWVFSLRISDWRPPIRILVNGQTGAAAGRIPFSWAKLALIAGTVLGLLALPGIVGLLLKVLG